ncbi:hypothetical protein [Pseudomonas sp. B21-028]|uniref:hypothetical protein n=1 Tax=Pseudomonas sp. B21-028 TaxID=2895480 RepID=UPI0038D37F8B
MSLIVVSYRYAERGVYACGPLSSTFKPATQKVYLVEFVIIEAGCEQHVYDVTQPQERIPVASASGL